MAKGFAIHNAITDHGGVIPSTQTRTSQMGNLFVRAGDGHMCPKCRCWSVVIKSHDHIIMDGKPVAYVGDKLSCGATIQPQQSHVVGESGSPYSGKDNQKDSSINKKFDEQVQIEINNSFSELFGGLGYRLKVGEKVIEGTFDSYGKTERFETQNAAQVSEFEIFFKDKIKYFSDLEGEE
ncbi:PAAR domain-containing protein [Acinetobacter sp. V117_2]|uniref:PAAR domain-containing protein n=1 Tax=Acinetobacter sp. V117_2 TaxID=3072989 RepID=UPI00287D698F|nr:PAAR domain-containing protein [Acinetobacter sp. V117_2]MDS7965622.1 PAAR domain-containing protein [Acinetobacter sp. V117_2]